MERQFLSVKDVCQLIGLSKPKVLKLVNSTDEDRRLPSYRPTGVKILIRESELYEWLERHRTNGPVVNRLKKRRKCKKKKYRKRSEDNV